MESLIGKKVMDRKTMRKGTIVKIDIDLLFVQYHDEIIKYPYPAAFAETLILENEGMQEELHNASTAANYRFFVNRSIAALDQEIKYLHLTGGKKYRAIDGERIISETKAYIYIFDTDSELHFPEGTGIKIYFEDTHIPGNIMTCEDFSLTIHVAEYLGETVDVIEFTADQWFLLEKLNERISEIDPAANKIAYELACSGRTHINVKKGIALGQDYALRSAGSNPITFIWGPPGTGKTTTLANIAMEELLKGHRVLMLSYSNVSVDGAMLRVADRSDKKPGQIIRYGYPRSQELLDSDTLTSYAYVLHKHPELAKQYQLLQEEKRKLKRKDARRTEINIELRKIRNNLQEQEKVLIRSASFLATTVSKALSDPAVYSQKFDTVIFDEASMAYIPQIVFAASLAKKHFCCLGDFRQLPAIVQNPENNFIQKDIFEYTGITEAVQNGYGHDWLVMLNIQYRMHPDIAEFASINMYEGLLQTAPEIYSHRQAIADLGPSEKEPISMIDLSDSYSVCIKTMDNSRINLMSAMMSVRIAELISDRYAVGIITPYSAQSRLILAMVRDLQEKEKKYKGISCATVHQFQGSEKPVIIYDAVDCYRMAFPGTLLTSKKNDMADRLFNVAITRTQGKFILIANKNYLFRKNISKNLMFTKLLKNIEKNNVVLRGEDIFEKVGSLEGDNSDLFLGDRDEVDSWERYLYDLGMAKKEIYVDVPGLIDDDIDALNDLAMVLDQKRKEGIHICYRVEANITVPQTLKPYVERAEYVTTPVTIIDQDVTWFGEPLSSADFVSEGNVLKSSVFPCMRFQGKYTARSLKAFLGIAVNSNRRIG